MILTPTNEGNQNLPEGYKVTPLKNGLTINYQGAAFDQTIHFEYKTKVPTDFVLHEATTFENKISDGTSSTEGAVKVRPHLLTKHGKFEPDKKRVKWSITFNQDKLKMNNIVIKDNYKPAELDLESLEVSGTKHSYEKKVTKDGFQLTFNQAIEETVTIEYYTNYTDDLIRDIENGTVEPISNLVDLEWTDKNGESHRQSLAPITPKMPSEVKNNGSKYGHYNKENQTIAWTIKVNENQRRLSDAYLIDQIPEEQTYVAGSLKVVGTPSILSKEEPNAKNNQTLKVSFPENSTSLYTITFVTKVQQEGKVIKEEYKNLAKLYDKKYKKPINLQGTVQPENGGKVINKTGKQNGTLMDWSVTLNQSQSHLINGKLKDELDANSLFIEKSFKLVDSKGQNVAIKPVIETKSNNGKNQGQILSIDLPTPMKESYTLTYQTEYIGHEKWEDHITNKASFEAEGLEAHKNEGSDHFDYSVSEAMGSTHGENGKLKIKKVGDHGEVLSGVTFQLLNSQGIIVAENTTDSNGEIQFKGRRYGEYLLKEVKTKDQYEISQELANGIKELIVDSNGSEIKALVLENERVKFDIPVEKIWEDNQNSAKLRPGSIEITLMRQAGNSKVETVKTVSLNEQSGWHHLFKDQPKYTSDDPTNRQEYTYSVKEKKVAHYRSEVMPSEDHLSFKIKNTYQSSPLILNAKKELTGKKLVADAYSFELKDATGQVLDTASNDATGKIVFKELTYDKVGTYAYTITEKAGSEPGMTYDSHVLKVNVNVTDEGGKLVATGM